MRSIIVVQFLVFVMFNFIHPITPELFIMKGIDTAMFGLSYACMSMGMFVAAPYWGRYINKHDRGKIVWIALTCYGLSQLAFCFAVSPAMMISMRFISGIFAAVWMVTSITYIIDLTNQDNRLKYISYAATAQLLGNAVGMYVAGQLGEINILIPVIFQLVFLFGIGMFANFKLPTSQVAPKEKQTLKMTYERTTIFYMLVAFLGAMAYVLFFNGINFYFTDVYYASPSLIGNLQFSFGIISLVTMMFLLPKINKKFNATTILVVSSSLAILSMVCFAAANNVYLAFLTANITIFLICTHGSIVKSEASLNCSNVATSVLSAKMQQVTSMSMMLGGLFAGFAYGINVNLPAILSMMVLLSLAGVIVVYNLNMNKSLVKE